MPQRIDHAIEKLPGSHLFPVQRLGKSHVNARRLLQRIHAEPCLDGRPAPVRHQKAHGHIRHKLRQRLAKVVGRGAEVARRRRRGALPGALTVLRKDVGIVPLHGVHAHERRGGRVADGLIRIGHALVVPAAQRHLHVGLAAAHPHFADKDVSEDNFLLAGAHHQLLGNARSFPRRDIGPPRSVGQHPGRYRLFLPGGRYLHRSAGLPPARNRHHSLLLQHRMAGKKMMEPELLRIQGNSCQQSCQQQT